MLLRLISSSMLAALAGCLGIETSQQFEKKVTGGRALSVKGLIARHTVRAAIFSRMKEHRPKSL